MLRVLGLTGVSWVASRHGPGTSESSLVRIEPLRRKKERPNTADREGLLEFLGIQFGRFQGSGPVGS